MAKRKGKFGKFGPQRTSNRDQSKVQFFGCQEMETTKGIVLNLRRKTTTREKGRSSCNSRSERIIQELEEGISSGSLLRLSQPLYLILL